MHLIEASKKGTVGTATRNTGERRLRNGELDLHGSTPPAPPNATPSSPCLGDTQSGVLSSVDLGGRALKVRWVFRVNLENGFDTVSISSGGLVVFAFSFFGIIYCNGFRTLINWVGPLDFIGSWFGRTGALI